jgi:putative Mg2+ transporter-C (MgtC) family protein
MNEWEAQLGVVAGVAYAMLLGGIIGFEREMKNRPAGFRTHMLVAGAAALLVGMGPLMLAQGFPGAQGALRIDPLRLVEAVVAGVAFIGAGTILGQRRGRNVVGLTTASSLLMVAIIGIAVGLHQHLLAAAAAALTLLVLFVLSRAEGRFMQGDEDDS